MLRIVLPSVVGRQVRGPVSADEIVTVATTNIVTVASTNVGAIAATDIGVAVEEVVVVDVHIAAPPAAAPSPAAAPPERAHGDTNAKRER